MPWSVADTIYDRTHTWVNENDRVAFERAFASGTLAERRIAQAVLSASPATPNASIREMMTAPLPPPRYGYPDEALGIDDVFGGGVPSPPQAYPADYSGGAGSYTGSDRNVTVP